MLVGLLLLLIAPEADTQTPALRSTQIGTVAPFDVKASHTFTWERSDPAGVDAARQSATASVLPVWDHDPSIVEQVASQTSRAFENLRSQLRVEASKRRDRLPLRPVPASETAETLATVPDEAAPADQTNERLTPVEPATGPYQEDYPPERVLELLEGPDRVEFIESLAAFDELAGDRAVRLPTRALSTLAGDGFSPRAQEALDALIRNAMARNLVADRSLLDDLGPEGITLRVVAGERPSERAVRNYRDFYDIGSVRDIAYGLTTRLSGLEDPALVSALEDLLFLVARPTTHPNPRETNRRRAAAADEAEARFRSQQRRSFQEGELIVRAGEVITPEVYAVVEQMRSGEEPSRARWLSTFALGVLLALLLYSVLVFAQLQLRFFSASARDLTMMGTVLVVHVGVTSLFALIADAMAIERGSEALYIVRLVIPFGMGAMLVRLLTRADNAIVYSLLYAMITGILLDYDVEYALLALVAGLVGGMMLGTAESRATIFVRCLWMGGALAALTLTLSIARGGLEWQSIAFRTLAAFGSGPLSAALLFFLLPVLEYVFHYTTPLRLMELSSLNHPLLRRLILEAPGTYHHSMMVGQLVEAGCEAVGANALLGRVGSYFHDIGKMRKQQYFAENQRGKNPHDAIGPYNSASIIKNHVREGVEMAREFNLPDEIVQFIREHHGTSLIRYFYHKALQENPDAMESDFRYPGPVPQTRETAICLLADGIEAASRAMPDTSPARLRGLIQRMINNAFIDGQLDQCDLTLGDLHRISDAFYKRLTAFYHHRPEYPDARKSNAGSPRRSSGSSAAVRESSGSPAVAADAPAEPHANPTTEPPFEPEDAGTDLQRDTPPAAGWSEYMDLDGDRADLPRLGNLRDG